MKQLPVPFIGQGHSLPTGCESVSAAMTTAQSKCFFMSVPSLFCKVFCT